MAQPDGVGVLDVVGVPGVVPFTLCVSDSLCVFQWEGEEQEREWIKEEKEEEKRRENEVKEEE